MSELREIGCNECSTPVDGGRPRTQDIIQPRQPLLWQDGLSLFPFIPLDVLRKNRLPLATTCIRDKTLTMA